MTLAEKLMAYAGGFNEAEASLPRNTFSCGSSAKENDGCFNEAEASLPRNTRPGSVLAVLAARAGFNEAEASLPRNTPGEKEKT